MIPYREILSLRGEWGLREDVIEKDYVLGWMLAAIAEVPELRDTWVFKGGTCLRKCFFETYRFSEDLDFTVVANGPEAPEDLVPIFGTVRGLLDEIGIEIFVDDKTFVRRRNRRGATTTEGRIGFRGPSNPPSIPKLKIDLTSDEILVGKPTLQSVLHPYSDSDQLTTPVSTYSLTELFAEKIRALAERCRPRDLYDVVSVHRNPNRLFNPESVLAVLREKCAYAGIGVPTTESIHESPYRDELDQEWANMLDHQLPHLPPVTEFWSEVENIFGWLLGRAVSQPAALDTDDDHTWVAPRGMTAWGRPAPLELIRFAGANRLRVEVNYIPEEGRAGWRKVEPLAFRTSRQGRLLLYVITDRGQLRSYGVDRLAGVKVLNETFTPRYRIEF